jgi:Ca2+-binding EF-hand superfamily protein
MLLLFSVCAIIGATIAAPSLPKIEIAASAIVNGNGKADAEAFEKAADLNKDKKLSEDEVIEVSGRYVPYGILEKAFEQADKKKNGLLTEDEVILFLDAAHKLLIEEAERALKTDDKDKNGKISKKEAEGATDLLEIEIEHFDKHFTAADADKDGELNEKELINFVVSNKHAFVNNYHNELLNGADTSKDAKLDLKEFTEAVTGHYPKAAIKATFDESDLNKDGFLDQAEHLISTQVGSTLIVKEYLAALPEVDMDKSGTLNHEELKKMAAKLDIDGVNDDFVSEYFELAHGGTGSDKDVDEQEALSFLTNGQSGIPTFFKDFDKDKSKTMSEAEAMALGEKLKFDAAKFKTAFTEADKDKNGQLTPLELRTALNLYTVKAKGKGTR